MVSLATKAKRIGSGNGQGEDAKITVFFEKAGKRKLVAKFANLELL